MLLRYQLGNEPEILNDGEVKVKFRSLLTQADDPVHTLKRIAAPLKTIKHDFLVFLLKNSERISGF